MKTILDYVAAIEAELAAVTGTSGVGDAEAHRHRARRRYAWRFERDEFDAPAGRGRPDEGKQIKTLLATFQVTIEGKTFEETWMLRSSLLTAAGRVLGGHTDRNYRTGPAEWFSRVDNQDPNVCVQELTLVVPFFAVDLPTGAPPQDAPDNRFTRVTIQARAITSADFVETPPP